MKDLKAYEEIHIIGIGGAGMSAIARVLRGHNIKVRGSDQAAGPMVKVLQEEGIPVVVGHAPENLGDADLVLASSAVPDDNPEILAAQERQIPVLHRPDFLPLLTSDYKVIAVAGAHGKTTITGMIALIMMEAGLDPSFIIGGVVQNLGTNARVGESPYFVIEADEYQKTFLALEPQVAVVSNIEHDHPDIFPNLRFLRLAFGDFVDRVHADGLLIACNDDEVAHAVAASFHANGGRLALYGERTDRGLALQAVDIQPNAIGGVDFNVVREGHGQLCHVSLRLPGTHNAVNALAALLVAEEVGVDWPAASVSLGHFEGMARRFEILGEAAGVLVVDDYAHHPTQIQVVLAAAKQRYPGRRLVVVWQPHTFSRIKTLREDFATSFGGADKVVVLPIYAAREVDDGTVNAQDLASEIQHAEAVAVESFDEAVQILSDTVQASDVVILMGAGDEYLVGRQLLDVLAGR